jgi:hypothetical protein
MLELRDPLLRAPVSAAPLRRYLHPTGVGALKLARHVRLKSVTLTGKTLSAMGCRPLVGGLVTPAAESTQRTPEPHPRARSGKRCGRALVGRPTPGQAKLTGPALLCRPDQAGHERTVALGHVPILAQWPIWGKEIPFLFSRIVKSVSKLPKFISNLFLVQKL